MSIAIKPGLYKCDCGKEVYLTIGDRVQCYRCCIYGFEARVWREFAAKHSLAESKVALAQALFGWMP